ncbi:S-adenosyl methyltransferase [Halopolyspora algeriensis]|uniref:S-adenosyl methyltransferase n=1 Tax=Halopolyspora algeriensis TaxID=1500506 RepID=A0A368VS30_9ACTN|nr:SAM-dependent methyltransferase [Halopolyspora algeriensis]RCW43925.1 S-adenosyl methyltransferase [Halopolyspora algeriensis]TQM53572.1 S-adenosyl methyltransferase [Halopolyspora algeriensis]
MEDRPNWLPKDVDLEKPSAARCYDYYLGGAHNFAVDRELARQVVAMVPQTKALAQDNRAFLRRAVRYCVDRGIRQFLDIGSGIPTAGNVHEVAQEIAPEARVVYVDNEPVAVAHSRSILDGNEYADVVQADLVDAAEILDSPQAKQLLNFDEPIAVLMVALFHFVPDSAQPKRIIGQYSERMAPGSYLGLSHLTQDDFPEDAQGAIDLYANSSNPMTMRSRAEVTDLLSDFELVDPGVVYLPEWRPDSPEDVWEQPELSMGYAALGHKV